MLILSIHLPVFTERGQLLGSICDLMWDTESFIVVQLCVKKNFFSRAPFLVHVSHIVRVEADRVVVTDATASVLSQKKSFGSIKPLKSLGERGQAAPAQRRSGEGA
ncbi:MAG: hypothetical protein UX39_C0002G0048 [Candidatus Magasanikbacteria bacterium GW2011_GWA2_46_17]|uniref:PRC-barrel domain-containing protein n=1 Tax=Candidatus Magasanikbacteria bacterium GW2011_GWA2_46_17 TaxID=1619042 RepID=A0A0G1P2Z1_9BACT|nr:MAG: hypothetical protein UX39_C0002G0048 [Candidatus Magasanikbacteria bacterium GW2011_GWA2_46_17]HBF67195.1 hypothetical protein [Candidatus Magasanikbacteria bacterium]